MNIAYNSTVTVSFDVAHALRVRVLAVRYSQQTAPSPAPPTTFAPTPNDLQHLQSWLGRAYPVAQVIWSAGTIDANRAAPFTSGDINAQLAASTSEPTITGW